MVYIADVNGFGVIVYDYRRNVAWRTQNKYFYPNPDNGTFTIRGESFDLMDGVFGMALSRKNPSPRAFGFHHIHASPSPLSVGSDRYLFFHSLASTTENRVAINVLDNQTAWNQNPDFSPRSFVVSKIRKKVRSTRNEWIFVLRKLEREFHKVQPRRWIGMEICSLDSWIQYQLHVGIQANHIRETI